MADFASAFAGPPPDKQGEKPKDSKEYGDEFSDLESAFSAPPPKKEKSKQGTKDNPLKGAVDFADKAMGAIGVDLRTEGGTTRKPKNWLEGQAQDIAKTSREEVSESRKLGPVRATGAKVVGAGLGIPRLIEDARNASKGVNYGAGELVRRATGVNPVEAARQFASKHAGEPIAPALGAFMELGGLSEPTNHVETLTKSIGSRQGGTHLMESGQTNIINAIPLGVGGNVAKGGLGAAYKAGVHAGGTMAGLAGVQAAGRETAQTGKTFNPENVAREAAKAAIVGGVAGGVVHLGGSGFSKIPKNFGRKPEAHTSDTIVSTKPIEPMGPKEPVQQAKEVAAQSKEVLQRSKLLGKKERTVSGAFDKALKANQKVSEMEASLSPAEDLLAQHDVHAELAKPLDPHPEELKAVAGELPEPSKLQPKAPPEVAPDVQKLKATIADRKKTTPEQRRQAKLELKKAEKSGKAPVENPPVKTEVEAPKEAPKPEPTAYEKYQAANPDKRYADYLSKGKPGAEKVDAAPAPPMPHRARKLDLTEPPPKVPESPPPREEGVITRAEFKRRTVQSRTATPEEVARYSEIADAVAEHDYHQKRYEAGLKELANDEQLRQSEKMMTGSHEKALSPESGEINRKVADAITRMRKAAGHADEPTVDVYDKTFMGEHKFEPLKGNTPEEKWMDLENARIDAEAAETKVKDLTKVIKGGDWKAKSEPSYKVDDTTYIPVKVTASDGSVHHVNVVTKSGGKKAMTGKEAQAYAIKDVQSRYGATPEGAHPRAINVPTARGDVLLESYRRKPSFTQNELTKAEKSAGNNPEFQKAKAEYLELKPKRDKAGEYLGVDYKKLHGILRDFIIQEHGGGREGSPLGLFHAADVAEGVTRAPQAIKEIGDIWATHVLNKNKKALEDFLADREVQREFQGSNDKTKLQRAGEIIRIALMQKNDMDWVRGYSPELAQGLEAIRSQMDDLGQGIEPLDNNIQAREEFADAIDMTPDQVREHDWQHLTKKQAGFIADISELRGEAADMISDTWDIWNEEGRAHSLEAIHMKGLYDAYTGGVDIRTGSRAPKRLAEKALNHLNTGIYDALITGNKRIHTLHIVDALTMGTSVVHPKNLMHAAYEFATNKEVRDFLSSYQGAGVYKQTRGSKLTWYEKNLGKAIEMSAEKVFGKKGLEALRKLEGGWLEKYKIDFIRGAAILRAGKEMGYKGNILQDVAKEYATGKRILSPVEHTELSIRVLNQLEDAFGYNPAGFVNRNAFRMLHLDSVFPFMGIRSVQNRLLGKFIAERNLKGLLVMGLATQAFAGSSAMFKPVEDALAWASPETYIQFKHLSDLVSIAGAAEAGLKATGVMNEKNEQYIAPFLRRIEHIQPEVVPWLYNTPKILFDTFNTADNSLRTNIVRLSALMGGSSLAGITTPKEIEEIFRYLDKGLHGEVSWDGKKLVGGKKMQVYAKQPFGEKSLGTKQHIPTNAFREMMNHLLPQSDVIDERYATEAKFGAAAKTQLMRNGYNDEEVKKIFNQFYRPIHAPQPGFPTGRAADAEDFLRLLHEHREK